MGRCSPRDLAAIRSALLCARRLGLVVATGDHVTALRAAAGAARDRGEAEVADDARAVLALPVPPHWQCTGDAAALTRLATSAALDYDVATADGGGGEGGGDGGDGGGGARHGVPAVLASCCDALLQPLATPATQQEGEEVDVEAEGDAEGSLAHALDVLCRALVDHPAGALADGGFVRPGFSAELDEAVALRDHSRDRLLQLQQALRDETGIASLKVRQTPTEGHAVEVPARFAASLDPRRFRLQRSLKASSRFRCDELSALDRDVAVAAARATALEQAIFGRMCGAVTAAADAVVAVSRALAVVDVTATLAEVASMRALQRPHVHDGDGLLGESAESIAPSARPRDAYASFCCGVWLRLARSARRPSPGGGGVAAGGAPQRERRRRRHAVLLRAQRPGAGRQPRSHAGR